MHIRFAVVTLTAAAVLAGFAVFPTAGYAGAASVQITGFSFSPASLSVPVGTTVTWTNSDAVAHTVSSDSGAFDSGAVPNGGTYSFTFNQAGTFAYHCAIHPEMHGTVIVGSGAGTDTPTSIPTVQPANTPTSVPTVQPTNTPTVLPTSTATLLPTATSTPLPTATSIPVVVATATQAPTATQIAATVLATTTLVATSAPAPTAAAATATGIAVPATAGSEPSPTPLPTATVAPLVAPTATLPPGPIATPQTPSLTAHVSGALKAGHATRLTVTVKNEATGKAVGSARVTLDGRSVGIRVQRVTTDKKGVATFATVLPAAAGTVRISVTKPHFSPLVMHLKVRA